MKKSIIARGIRVNNLKNIDIEIPHKKLVVITGVSGSGKSSLAFDTLFAEGQRRYVESFSAYARQFLERMDKPDIDHIEGIPPAIAIQQKNPVKTGVQLLELPRKLMTISGCYLLGLARPIVLTVSGMCRSIPFLKL